MSLLDVFCGLGVPFAFVAVCMLIERAGPAERNTTWRGTLSNLAWSAASLTAVGLLPFPLGWLFRQLGIAGGILKIEFPESVAGQLALTVAALFASDLVHYWYHRAQHRFVFMWHFHKIHHAATEFNASVTQRIHPLEHLVTGWWVSVAITLLFDFSGGDWHLAQRIPLAITAWGYFLHLNVKLDMGPLTWVVAGPQWHRYHHSSRPEHAATNFAPHFPVWDLLFGTACRPAADDYPATGWTRAAVVVLAVGLAGCGPAKPWRGVRSEAYGPDPLQAYDAYLPHNGKGPRPALIAIHGGGWQGGDKAWGRKVAEEYCPRGYVVVALNYRLAPAARWPAQIDDCQAALSHVTSSAAGLGIDPARIGALGSSAGGHLAAMLALRDRGLRCAVTASGEGDLTVLGVEPIMADEAALLTALLGPDPSMGALRDLSPTTFARPDASVLVVHATGDANVYYDQGRRLHEALVLAGADTGLLTLRSPAHNKAWQDATPQASRWLRARLGGSRARRESLASELEGRVVEFGD